MTEPAEDPYAEHPDADPAHAEYFLPYAVDALREVRRRKAAIEGLRHLNSSPSLGGCLINDDRRVAAGQSSGGSSSP